MKISHETPKCLLKWSKSNMDYQYALVHLLEEDEEYREHFLQCKKDGIPIYLDNSLHELGEAIGGKILEKWINILEPQHVFVPDVWENSEETIKNSQEWSNFNYPSNTTPIAIVQATSYDEASKCYSKLKEIGYNKIAFSYGAHYYNGMFPHPNRFISGALGRVLVISKMFEEGIIWETDKIHLLGTYTPLEFSFYKDMPFIESIDTSNPVMAAIDNMIYDDLGIFKKPSSNMNKCFEIPKEDVNLHILEHNIQIFRKLTK
jgi:hypothetical protein